MTHTPALLSLSLLAGSTLLSGCALSHHAEVPTRTQAPDPAPRTWSDLLAGPAVLEHEAVVSARWQVPLSGLLDLDDPQAAGLEDGDAPIVLPVHVFRHPVHGTVIVDTGVDTGLASELSGGPGRGPLRGMVPWFVDGVEVVEPLGGIIARQPAPLAGVYLTHMHLDHVLGLPDVPPEVPVTIGAGEQQARRLDHLALRGTYRQLLGDRTPLSVLSADDALQVGGLAVHDLLGDGSLWALHVPGHTDGSLAYLAHTEDGPVLLTGDCSHTRWGWDHGVSPGTFTSDSEANRHSLAALRDLAEEVPGLQVFVGHELPGEADPVDQALAEAVRDAP